MTSQVVQLVGALLVLSGYLFAQAGIWDPSTTATCFRISSDPLS